MNPGRLTDSASASGAFPKTHWSAILAAGQEAGAAADTALAELCGGYWYPLYAFARRKGHQPADAQDLTQVFFIHLIEARLVRRADPHKGRFRSFLLGCFARFLASEADRAQAQKRGGEIALLPIDVLQAEQRLAAAPASTASPEALFDRHWAVAVLDAALVRIEAEMRDSGRGALFEQLLPSLEGDDDQPRYAEIARRLETTEETVKTTVYRLRRRYRDLIRQVVSQTVHNPLEVDTELAHLMAALRA